MIDQPNINHHIQKHIIGVLYRQKYARFRDLRPPKVDTNLYSYHLKKLISQGIVRKIVQGYTLDKKGLLYSDRVSQKNMTVRTQPKIVTMLVVQNHDGDILLLRRNKQPYIDRWTLPYGKVHIDDETIERSALREAEEKLGVHWQNIPHVGDCYIRVYTDREVFTSTIAHVFYIETDDIILSERLQWVRPHKLNNYDLAPAVEQIVARTFFRDSYFFEEFDELV